MIKHVNFALLVHMFMKLSQQSGNPCNILIKKKETYIIIYNIVKNSFRRCILLKIYARKIFIFFGHSYVATGF